MISDVAAFLLVPTPKKTVKYEGTTITPDRLREIQDKPGYHVVDAFVAVSADVNRDLPTVRHGGRVRAESPLTSILSIRRGRL